MSVIISLTQISRQFLEPLKANPDAFYPSTDDYSPLANEMRTAKVLDLGTNWGIVDFIFCSIYGIDVFQGKHRIDYNLAYYKPHEVAHKAQALRTISDESISLCFDYGMDNNINIYRFAWSKNNRIRDLDYTFQYCNLVRNFYLDASQNGFAIIIRES